MAVVIDASSASRQADMDLESQSQSQKSHSAVTTTTTSMLLLRIPQSRIIRWINVILNVHRFVFVIREVVKTKASATSYSPLLSTNTTTATLSESEQRSIELSTSILPQSSQEDATLVDININDATILHNQRANTAERVKHMTKDLQTLRESGGINAIATVLNTNLATGIPGDETDLCSRRAPGTSPPRRAATEASTTGFLGFLFKHCNDWTIILLVVAAALYTGFGIKKEGLKTGWYTGLVVIGAVIILVIVPTMRDLWLKHSALKHKLAALQTSEQNAVVVLREGSQQEVSVSDVVVGDVVLLNEGSTVPADGLFIDGEFLVANDGLEISIDEEECPFLYYGATVSHGTGRMLVTAVGTGTVLGELMSKSTDLDEVRSESDDYRRMRLPSQLDKLRKFTHILSLAITILIIVVLSLGLTLGGPRHFMKPSLPEMEGKPASKQFMEIVQRLVMETGENAGSVKAPLAILLLGVLEGMPIVIALAAIYWRKKMLSGKAFVLEFLDCVKMGSAATIVTDKTPLNPTDVAVCFIGGDDVAIQPGSTVGVADLCDGISTPLVVPSSPVSRATVEDPLLPWAASNLDMKLDELRRSRKVMKTKRLSSGEEGSGVLLKKRKTVDRGQEEEAVYVHWKGPATTILGKSSSYHDKNGETKALDEDTRKNFETRIQEMKHEGLNPVGFAYKKISSPSPTLEENDLIFLGILGLKRHKCCAETIAKLKALQEAGVRIVLVSEDDVSELKEIAMACGILPQGGLAISAEDFQELDDRQKMDKVDKICVMGNATPSDKLLLMKWLKKKESDKVIVALGTRTSEAPALKEADIGVAMGDWSSGTAKESSDSVVRDGTLSSLLEVIRCGRCTYLNIQKYIQVELVTNVAGMLVASVTTMWRGSSPITSFQLIWATFVMTVVAGPALLLERPRNELLLRPPVALSAPLISKPMWRNIVAQILYQTTILITFHFKGKDLPLIGVTKEVSKTMIFNAFVLCQLFNLVNSREIEKMNTFAGIYRNWWLFVAVPVVVTLQLSFVEEAHAVVDNASLDFKQWGVCFLIGLCSCPVDLAAKCVSNVVEDRKLGSRNGSTTTMVHSDSADNLELPLMSTENSSSVPSQE